jgi:tetratricopeptide (TPR) repeat protein
MSAFAADDSLLATAQAHAGRGEWGIVRELIAAVTLEHRSPELALLLAEAHLRTGDLEAAHAALLSLVPLLARQGNSAPYRRAVNMLGAAAFELGRMAEAETRFDEALALADAGADPLTLGRATNNLGMIAHIRGQYDKALARYQLAVPAYQRLGFTAGLAETHHNMALALRELGQLESADKQERRAIEFAREAGNLRLLAIAHVGRAELALRRGEPAVAQAGARLGADQYAAIPDAVGEADALRLVGAASTVLGETAAARVSLERAVRLAHSHGSTLIEAESHEARARLHLVLEQWSSAEHEVQEARRLYRQLGATAAEELLEQWYHGARPSR